MSIIGFEKVLVEHNRADHRAQRLERSSIAALILTSVHHLYGAYIYGTAWRAHVLAVTVPAILASAWASRRLREHPADRVARRTLVVIAVVVSVLLFGVFEGMYNHLTKDVLFYAGASAATMRRLFPAPMYEMPNDGFFEITGVAQAFITFVVVARLLAFRSPAAGKSNGADRTP